MPIFSFTVGSLGDIVSLLQIAKTVTRALCDSKGCSEEYFDLISELDSVVRTVEAVQHELSVDGPNKLPPSVENALRLAIQRCLHLLQQIDKKISAWRNGIGIGWTFGKDVWLLLGWSLFTREELIGLRRRLSSQIEAMNTLLILAHGERLERFSRKQDEHVLEIRRKIDEHASEMHHKQDEIVSEIRRRNIDRRNADHQDWLSRVSSQTVLQQESWESFAPRQALHPSRHQDSSTAFAKSFPDQRAPNIQMPAAQSHHIPWQPRLENTLSSSPSGVFRPRSPRDSPVLLLPPPSPPPGLFGPRSSSDSVRG